MKKVALFSVLLVIGLAGSQLLPGLLSETWLRFSGAITVLTMVALAFIMIHVGYEFELDKSNPRAYAWDYIVAMTAAAFPWIFVTLYLLLAVLPGGSLANLEAWKESLLAGRFAAPTSAGVLFSMLAAAGLSATWLFRKARVLAIFDDLDTVLLMVPLKMLIVGIAWQLGLVVLVMVVMLWLAWRFLHCWAIPLSWPWVLGYAGGVVLLSELVHFGSIQIDPRVPIHLEVLLPAFVLGCVMKRPPGAHPHDDDAREGHQEGPESATEQRVATIVSAVFMVLVGLSMPAILGPATAPTVTTGETAARISASQPMLGWGVLALHVAVVTVLANLGKMFAAFCYRGEAHWRERLAVAIGLWPRGEVGAGVLVISMSYGIGGPVLTVAMLSLALNLVLTGVFIAIVKRLAAGAAAPQPDGETPATGSAKPGSAGARRHLPPSHQLVRAPRLASAHRSE